MAQERGSNMRILQDGSVEIRNKKTGEKKVIAPQDLPSYGISYSTYESELKSFKNVGGETKAQVNEIAAKEPSVEEKKYVDLGKSGLRTLEQVKSIYEKDPNVLAKQLIPGKFATRDFDNALFNTVDTLLRIRTGAQAPESEVRAYMTKLGPNFGDSPQVVEQKLNNLMADLSSPAGAEATPIKLKQSEQQTTGNPLADTITQNPILNFLIGGATRTAQDIGTGIRSRMAQPALQQDQQTADSLSQQAKDAFDSGDYETAKMLFEQAKNISGGVSTQAQDISKSFTTDVNDNPALRGLSAGAEIAGAASLPGLSKLLSTTIKQTPKKLNLMKKIGDGRAAAANASKVTVSGDEVVRGIEKWANNVASGQREEAKKFVEAVRDKFAGKKLSAAEGLTEKSSSYDSGYLLTRQARGAEAAGERKVAEIIKNILHTDKEIAKFDKKFDRLYNVKKFVKGSGFAAKIAGGNISGNVLYDMLFGGK